jgi:hypothetical protein
LYAVAQSRQSFAKDIEEKASKVQRGGVKSNYPPSSLLSIQLSSIGTGPFVVAIFPLLCLGCSYSEANEWNRSELHNNLFCRQETWGLFYCLLQFSFRSSSYTESPSLAKQILFISLLSLLLFSLYWFTTYL